MRARHMVTTGLRIAAGALACAGAVYTTHTALTWLRYGRLSPPRPDERDPLLDRFMPHYDVVDRMRAKVRAPADVTLAAAEQQNLMEAPGVSAIFRLRQVAMGSTLEPRPLPTPLLEQVKALGWVELARVPGREVVLGAVTQPWFADVVFRSIPPEEFAAFNEPDYVKIAWTLRAVPCAENLTLFSSETRAIATDARSRARFRNYWSMVAPGVWFIRRLSAAPMKRRAERQFRHPRAGPANAATSHGAGAAGATQFPASSDVGGTRFTHGLEPGTNPSLYRMRCIQSSGFS